MKPSYIENFFSTSLEMHSVCDFAGYFVLVNPAFEKALGWTSEELKSRPYVEFVHPDDQERTRAEAKSLTEGRQTRQFENRYMHKDGSYRTLRWNATVDNEQQIICANASDVTEQKKSETNLRTLYSMIQESHDGFCYADPVGKPLFINQALIDELGWSLEVESLRAFFSVNALPGQADEMLKTAAIRDKQREGETKFHNFNAGEDVPYLVRCVGLWDDQGRLTHYGISATNLTQRKKWEVSMHAAAKMSSLGEMAGGIAHEINNPLAIIQGKAYLLKRRLTIGSVDPEEIKVELTKIENSVERIARIVSGLRTFSRESENDPFELVKVSTIVGDTLELCRERFRNRSIDLRVNICDDPDLETRASQIAQVLMNLLSNAHDAVEKLDDRWVELSVGTVGQHVEISVTDSGHGIPEAIADKCMDPFFTTKDIGKGTGLGLSISKGISELHHGRLRYDKNSPFTRFVLELPLKQPEVSH